MGATIAIWLLTPYYKSYSEQNREEQKIEDRFYKNNAYQDFLPKKSFEAFKQEQRINFKPNESILAVMVGESGIGKTTEICQYAEKFSSEGHSVRYVNLDKNANYKFEELLKKIFGTSDEEMIIGTIRKQFTNKGKVPTLILDNIHYAVINEKIDQGLLTFLNGQLYQGLKMAIIMLASVNGAAYEIDKCNFFDLSFPYL